MKAKTAQRAAHVASRGNRGRRRSELLGGDVGWPMGWTRVAGPARFSFRLGSLMSTTG